MLRGCKDFIGVQSPGSCTIYASYQVVVGAEKPEREREMYIRMDMWLFHWVCIGSMFMEWVGFRGGSLRFFLSEGMSKETYSLNSQP